MKVNIGDVYSETKRLSFSVPQGSCDGPVLYCAYASMISEIIPKLITLHAFTDDHAISDSFNPSIAASELNSVMKLSGCLDNVGSWMVSNRLKMNAKKTEVIYIDTRNQLDKCQSKEICVRNDLIPGSPRTKYLGAWINELLTFQHHINMKCKTAIWNLKKTQYLRQYVDQATCEILIHSLVMSHLDYVNITLFGVTDKVISRLQRVQNWVVKVILIKSKYDSSFEAKTLYTGYLYEKELNSNY